MELQDSTHSEKKILIVDDEPAICEILSSSLKDEKYLVKSAYEGISALQLIHTFKPHVVLLDIWMPRGKIDGIELLKKVKSESPLLTFHQPDFIIMSGHGNIETAVKAIKLGAWDFVEKPLSMKKLLILIQNIISYQEEKKEKLSLLNTLRKSIAFIGAHPKMIQLKQKIAQIASLSTWILIQGERGTGKKLLAQNIHYLNPKVIGPFVDFQCSRVPDTLMYQELFGSHKKNSLKPTTAQIKGKCDHAKRGTLYIDEIGNLNLETQEALLKLLENQSFKREKGTEWIPAHLRVIASTTKDLKEEVKKGRFNKLLFHHLSSLHLHLPPLRERSSDISLLIEHFSEQFSKNSDSIQDTFPPTKLSQFTQYTWPGNVKELKNRVEREFILPSVPSQSQPFALNSNPRVESK